jgi:hypothetical protein
MNLTSNYKYYLLTFKQVIVLCTGLIVLFSRTNFASCRQLFLSWKCLHRNCSDFGEWIIALIISLARVKVQIGQYVLYSPFTMLKLLSAQQPLEIF